MVIIGGDGTCGGCVEGWDGVEEEWDGEEACLDYKLVSFFSLLGYFVYMVAQLDPEEKQLEEDLSKPAWSHGREREWNYRD